jgi:hypothetical protein
MRFIWDMRAGGNARNNFDPAEEVYFVQPANPKRRFSFVFSDSGVTQTVRRAPKDRLDFCIVPMGGKVPPPSPQKYRRNLFEGRVISQKLNLDTLVGIWNHSESVI